MLPTATILVTTSFAVLTLISAIIPAEHCDHLGNLFYERLSCKPKYNKKRSECPIAYDCPKFNVSTDYCTFNNKQYKFREEINDTHYCNMGCFCGGRVGVQNPITCAAVDCPYVEPKGNKTCYNAHEPGGCCPSKQICEPFDDVPKCTLNGKTYMEGQFMETGNCWTCVCKEGFRGVMEEPYCIRMPCDLEIHTSAQIANKCAPKYSSKEAPCCPWYFLCPDHIKSELKVTRNESHCPQKEKCIFMDQQFNVGDSFEAEYSENIYIKIKNITCKCILPPQVACFE